MKLAGFCARCDARYKPGARFCDDCGAPRIIVTNPVPAEKVSAIGPSMLDRSVRATAEAGTDVGPPTNPESPEPPEAKKKTARWDLLGARMPAGGNRVTQALFTALAVAGLGLLLLSTQSVSLWTLLGWAPFAQLMAGLGLLIRALLPARSNLLASAIAGCAATLVIAWQFSAMTSLVPNWIFFISSSAASVCVISAILVLTRVDLFKKAQEPDGVPDGSAQNVHQSAVAVPYELLLLTCAVTTGGLLANLLSGEANLKTAATQAAIAASAGLGLWVLRTGRASWVVWIVCALLVLPGIANWADAAADVSTTTLCLVTGVIVALAQPLREGMPWAKRQRGGHKWTPPVGIGPRRNTIAAVIADLLAWLRTGWSAMIAAGWLFWATVLLVVVATLGLVMTPLALLGQVGSYVLETGATDDDPTPAWLIIGLLVAGGVLSYVLISVCAQATIGAVAAHDRGGQLHGRELAGRALPILGRQSATVARYALGVLVGALLGLIPGLILQVRWAFAVPVGASSGLSGSQALRAGWRFTHKRFWRTLIAQTIALLVTIAFVMMGAAAAILAQWVYGSTLVTGLVAFVPIALGVTCASVIMASLYRKYLNVPIQLTD